MTTSNIVTDNRIANIVAAKVIGELLRLMPEDQRSTILALATEAEARNNDGALSFVKIKEPSPNEAVLHTCAMQLKATVAFAFIRSIVNEHSPAEARRILLQHHAGAPGSGRLVDYLARLGLSV